MTRTLATGNHVAGHALALAGEANRGARGCCVGAYPITPQTEIIEYLSGYPFEKGRIVLVESEHSAMAVCMGAALAGARTFTASSSNGLAYMTENIFAAGYYRLPTVMMAVNRTLGPPWNIWVDQGDSLMMRDAAWLQFYCDSHQDLFDTTLMAFRIAEDKRIMLPVIVALDGFVTSHTQMVVEFPTQEQVDAFLPECAIPHGLHHDHPTTVGGLTWPNETELHRYEIQQSMEAVPGMLDEARDEFNEIFGRRPAGALEAFDIEDAETIVVACNTMARTLHNVIIERRAAGEKIGMIRTKLFRPFPRKELLELIGPQVRKIAVLDRNHSPGSGGIFWQEIATTLRERPDVLLQDYLVGLGGGDVTPDLINKIIGDLNNRTEASAPDWRDRRA
jgi:pyruvate/2-oxoacid:ferredoxin oxidoreductase alpha subunit